MSFIKSIYHHKWFPRLFYTRPDGGKGSGVKGYFLIEWKPFLSVGLLNFQEGSREAYHTHAFHAITFWLKGKVTEVKYPLLTKLKFNASLKPKYTPRDNFHKIIAHEDTYALTFRGPWLDYWYEVKNHRRFRLTHGRRRI